MAEEKSVAVSFRVTPRFKRLLEAAASQANRSQTNMLETLLFDVVGGEAFYRRRHPNVHFKKVGITNQFFNAQAHAQAELNGVLLVDQSMLGDLLTQHTVTMLELERLLYTDWESDAANVLW
jgi:hypothetical protein